MTSRSVRVTVDGLNELAMTASGFPGKLTNGDPVGAAVTYPETVDQARVLAMPQWRHRVTNHPNEIRRFVRDIEHHVGIEYRPFDSGWDPLGHWFHRRPHLLGVS